MSKIQSAEASSRCPPVTEEHNELLNLIDHFSLLTSSLSILDRYINRKWNKLLVLQIYFFTKEESQKCLDVLNRIISVLEMLIFIKLSTVNLCRSSKLQCYTCVCGMRMCAVRSSNFKGLGLCTGSWSFDKQSFMFILTGLEWSSTSFTEINWLCERRILGMLHYTPGIAAQ